MVSSIRHNKFKGLFSGLVVESEYNVKSLNQTWIKVIGNFAYDRDGRAYQDQGKGWICVCDRCLPPTVAGVSMKKVLRN